MARSVKVIASVIAPGCIMPAAGEIGTVVGQTKDKSLNIVRFKLPYKTSTGGTALLEDVQSPRYTYADVYLSDDEIEDCDLASQ